MRHSGYTTINNTFNFSINKDNESIDTNYIIRRTENLLLLYDVSDIILTKVCSYFFETRI